MSDPKTTHSWQFEFVDGSRTRVEDVAALDYHDEAVWLHDDDDRLLLMAPHSRILYMKRVEPLGMKAPREGTGATSINITNGDPEEIRKSVERTSQQTGRS